MIMLNTIMAESLDYMATILEKAVESDDDFDQAVQKLLTDIITEHGAVVSTATATRRTGRSRRRNVVCRTSRPRWMRRPS